MPLSSFSKQYSARKLAILRDDSAPEARAVLVAPCLEITAEQINETLHLTGGHVFACISREKADAFRLLPMTRGSNETPSGARQALDACVSVEARIGVSTGISAGDRATTLRVLGSAEPHPRDLVMPGHIFPIVVKDGGVLVKHALFEGAHDITRICFDTDGALVMELLGSDGEFLTKAQIAELADKQNIPSIDLGDLVVHRLEHERLVSRVAEAKLPTHFAGELQSIVYKTPLHSGEHVALVKGEIDSEKPVLTRVQPERTLSDVFGAGENSSRALLQRSLEAIGKNGSGVLVYLRNPEGGLLSKELSSETPAERNRKAIMREYGLGAQILRDLGVMEIDLMTGSNKSLIGLNPFGIKIVSQRPIPEC